MRHALNFVLSNNFMIFRRNVLVGLHTVLFPFYFLVPRCCCSKTKNWLRGDFLVGLGNGIRERNKASSWYKRGNKISPTIEWVTTLRWHSNWWDYKHLVFSLELDSTPLLSMSLFLLRPQNCNSMYNGFWSAEKWVQANFFKPSKSIWSHISFHYQKSLIYYETYITNNSDKHVQNFAKQLVIPSAFTLYRL